MGRFARFVARRVWFGCLWWMRRPFVKAARQAVPNLYQEPKRTQVRQRIIRSDAMSRKYGLRMLTVTFNLLFAYFLVTTVYWGVVTLEANGYLRLPDSVEARQSQSPR